MSVCVCVFADEVCALCAQCTNESPTPLEVKKMVCLIPKASQVAGRVNLGENI